MADDPKIAPPDNLTADPSGLVGQRLANFAIEGVLSQGGMAQVYYGLDIMLKRNVAIKVIDTRYRSDPIYAERFLREARSVAAWHHPHIIQIHYADKQDGLYYFVMELVDGYDLGELLQSYTLENKLIPHQDVLRIGWALANALDFAHEKGVIHRDVKPSNVMIAQDGRILLMDFGLALAVDEGSEGDITLVGTARYISPEQAQRSANAVPQSDLYSLGVILYEMLTGSRPFADTNPIALAIQHVQDEPPAPRELNPALSLAVEAALLKTLAKNPAERYRTGQELMTALNDALEIGQPVPGGRVYLPPLPPGVQADRMATSMSRFSATTIAEMLASRSKTGESQPGSRLDGSDGAAILSAADVTPPEEAVADDVAPLSDDTVAPSANEVVAEPTPNAEERMAEPAGAGWPPSWLMGIAGLFLLLLVIGAWGNRAGWLVADAEPEVLSLLVESDPTATVTATATATATMPTPSPTATETAVIIPPTDAATNVATLVATPTTTPSPTPQPTAEPTAEPSPTQPAPISEGHLVRLFYDEYNFYIWNGEASSLNIAPLSFEALTDSGETAGYIFRGRAWADIYPFLEATYCNQLRLVAAPETAVPFVCDNFNAALTLARDDDGLFWLPRAGNVSSFRVYWFGDVVGQCPLITGICELLLPTS